MTTDLARRRAVLAAVRRWRGVVDEVEALASVAEPAAAFRLAAHADLARRELDRAQRTYAEGIAHVRLARCPLTGQGLAYPIDTEGFDGPWWDSDEPIRPPARTPRSFFALTGATRLPAPAPDVAHVCLPGPGAPYVLPSLLDRPGMVAVLNALTIGDAPAWTISYFAAPAQPSIVPPIPWGLGWSRWMVESGGVALESAVSGRSARDFDLRGYFMSRKLHWIAPGDTSVHLRSGVRDCPYLDLDGAQWAQRLYRGTVTPWLLD